MKRRRTMIHGFHHMAALMNSTCGGREAGRGTPLAERVWSVYYTAVGHLRVEGDRKGPALNFPGLVLAAPTQWYRPAVISDPVWR